mmetsp:Transcript_68520/g.135419  ORF Transcript_68520/g.135419 Transcript_68520/m.135419 type:complete len:338 (-) Transcript_68520:203-1216(-)
MKTPSQPLAANSSISMSSAPESNQLWTSLASAATRWDFNQYSSLTLGCSKMRKTLRLAKWAMSVSIFCPSPRPDLSCTCTIKPPDLAHSSWWYRKLLLQHQSSVGFAVDLTAASMLQVSKVPLQGWENVVKLGSHDFLETVLGLNMLKSFKKLSLFKARATSVENVDACSANPNLTERIPISLREPLLQFCSLATHRLAALRNSSSWLSPSLANLRLKGSWAMAARTTSLSARRSSEAYRKLLPWLETAANTTSLSLRSSLSTCCKLSPRQETAVNATSLSLRSSVLRYSKTRPSLATAVSTACLSLRNSGGRYRCKISEVVGWQRRKWRVDSFEIP